MPRDKTRDVILSDDQIELIIEGLDYVRLASRSPQGAGICQPDVLRRFIEKEREAERLMVRLRRRLETRRQGHAGNYAERL